MSTIKCKLKRQHLVLFLGILISIVAFGTALIYYYANTYSSLRSFVYGNSDVLVLPSLYNDIVSGIDISNWKLSELTYIFPDTVLYFLSRIAMPNIFSAISVYGLVQYIFFVLGLLYLSKHVLPNNYGTLRYSIIIFIAIIYSLTSGKLLWVSNTIFINSSHFGVVVTIPWVLALTYINISMNSMRFKYIILLFMISLLLSFSDTLYTVQVTIPIITTLFILFLLKKIYSKRLLFLSSAILVPSIMGEAIKNLIPWKYPTLPLESYFTSEQMYQSSLNFVSFIKSMIPKYPLQTALVATFIGICIIILIISIVQSISLQSTSAIDKSIVYFPLYFLSSTIINFAAIIYSGRMCGVACLRYLLPFFIFSSWWGFPFIFRLPRFVKPAILERAVLIILVLTTIVASRNASIPQAISNTTDIYYPSFIKCVDKKTSELGIKYGIAQYWQARPISLLSQNGLKVVQVNPDLSPFHWLSNLAWYDLEPEFAVIDLSRPVGDAMRIDENLITSRYGEPDATFECEGSRILVYRNPNSKFKTLFSNILLK